MNNATLKTMTRAEREALLLAAQAARGKPKPAGRPVGIPARTAPRAHWPLSFSQQRLWFIAHMWPTAHVLTFGLSLRGPLDTPALQAALDRIVRRHEGLRTHFEVVDEQPVQRISETAGFTLLHHDLAEEGGEAAAMIDRWQREEASTPIDLEHGPMIRGRLLRLAEQDHVLLVTMHHIVSDGWSMGILANELDALYRAYAVQGVAFDIDPLPALPIQYADYALWQREWLTDEVQQRQAVFWREQLSGAPALVGLATDRPRPPVQDSRGELLPVAFDGELAAGLKALSQRHGTTLYMTLLAAWGALVGRLAGQDQVVIGSPVANRTRAEMESLIGFFVNTLALRIDLSDQPTVAQLLAQVRERVLLTHGHQDLPFEQVVDALKPERTLAHTPIFQVTFAWQNTPEETLELDGLQLSVLPPRNGEHNAQYDLELDLHETRDGIAGTLGFSRALYDRDTVVRFRDHLEALLRGMVRDDAQPVDAIDLLDAAERERVLTTWNDTRRDYALDVCVHERFERHAAAAPDAVAITFEGASITYGALDADANRLAHQLIAQGVRAETRVAVVAARGPALVTAWLAVLKAGGVYVAMDPAYPQERLAYMLDDSRPRVVLTEVALQDQLPSCRALRTAAVLVLDEPTWQQRPTTAPGREATGLQPAHLAYVIYTSGSTGKPNGVMVEHRHLANLIAWHSETFPLARGERTSSTAGVAFDACTWEVWPALCQGATLALPPSSTQGDPSALLDWWESQDLQSSFLVTALADAALARGQGSRTKLRSLLTGGDRLNRLPTADLPFALVNNYGPTETTVVATSGTLSPDDTVIHIGRPIANTKLYLLDRHGKPVPVGAPGELYIGGAQVARGYLNRPELTQARFLDDPFSDEPGARMYRTGDLGRWRADGTIEYLGRNDHQVKLRGLRIELGEIEAQLAAQQGIREAAVIAREDAPGEVRLVAYVVADGEAPEPQRLRDGLSRTLPEYMLPAAYVTLDRLPLTPNGKLDRRALPAPEGAAFAQRAYEAPEGTIETTLAAIWCELLRVERVGRHDNFFELGGHSLLAVQMMSRVRQRLGLEMTVSQLFTHPVMQAFAAALAEAPTSALPALLPAPRTNALPLSFAQQRLWFIAQMGTVASGAYHMPGGLRLRGALDVAALQAALDRVVARHEALRTRFEVVDGQPVQRIDVPAGFALERQEIGTGHASTEDAIAHWQSIEAETPFDLERGPLIRGRLLRLAEHDHVLLLTMHHIVFDGWSLGVLMDEFARLYATYATQGASVDSDPLPALAVQYVDYAAWQRDWLSGAVQAQQLVFWRDRLATAPALVALPTDRPRPAVQDYRGESLSIALDPQLNAGLKALSQRHGTTLFMTCLAAWGALVARLAGQDEVVIGTPVANRTRAEVEPLIGFFVNTLALRLNLGDRPTVAQLLAQVRESVLEAQSHQDLPFEQVVEALKPKRTMAHTPVFQLMFTWQGASESALDMPGLQLEELTLPPATAKFDLTLELQESEDRIVGTLCFATALYDLSTMQRHAGHLEALLRGMVRDDAQPVDAIDIMDAAERQLVLKAWNATHRDYSRDVCVHARFEQHAAEAPEAIAFEGDTVTYGELDAQAEALAQRLRALGVGPETRVALLLRRGPDLIRAMLAVPKAGGAYVPLDSSAPAERLREMLSDSAPRVVLTQSALSAQVDLSGEWAVLEVDALPPLAETVQQQIARMAADPNRLAYVIYTSGSTGKPNGVMVEHRQLANLIAWHSETFPLARGERTSSMAGVAFDACTWEVWPALCQGATLALPPSSAQGDPSALLDWWESQDLQSSFLVTALADVALARGQGGRTKLRSLLTGGDRLNRLPTADLPFALVNNYGPTETTVVATSGVISPDDTVIHIGRPIANTRLYLLDRHGKPVPVGAPGELYIGGAQVARGYLNRPELTQARFLDDPFSDEPGARMYRTGDLGRWRADGTIEYLGRNDHQVKLRGLRIELGEIEAQLAAQQGIREAAVIAREDLLSDGTPGEVRLVAYVVADGEAPEPQRLRDGLSRTLPEYMLPAAYVTLDRLPLTPNGKLDRRALPAPEGAAFAQRAYEAPQGTIETTLAAIWCELLRVERVGRHDNFFELGGHSMLVTRLIDGARRRGLLLDLRQVFDAPTLAGLATVVTLGGQGEETQTSLIPVRIAGSRRPLFCFHEGFGSVLAYERLARFIDADVPVYSMEARAMHEDPPVYRSLVEMARDYLRQIRAVQPVGPYCLAGWSGGGLIAYEVARQLLENGESVGYLGMIDTYRLSPEDMEGDIAQTKHFLIRILQYLRPELTPDVLRGLLAFDDLDAMVAECHRNGWLGPDVTGHEMDRRFRVANDIARASVQYVPPPIDLDVSLFSAQEPVRDDRSNGWSSLLGERLEVIAVGGTHMAMMQDETLLARIAGPMNRALLGTGAASSRSAPAASRSVDLSLS